MYKQRVMFVAFFQTCIEKIHLRRPNKTSYKKVLWLVKDLLWTADLLNQTIFHDDDAISQCHGFNLIMRNIDKRCLNTLAQFNNLCAHKIAQIGVKVGKRLIHEEHSRITHNRPSDSYTLTLAS